MSQVQSMLLGHCTRTRVGQLAGMPAARSTRIHFKLVSPPGQLGQMHKHPLGQRTAANIPHTHKQNFLGHNRSWKEILQSSLLAYQRTGLITYAYYS
jgi:hypothetical protein